MSEKPRILVADDQADVVEALRLLLKGGGFLVDAASSPDEVVRLMEKRPFDALLMDLNYTRDTTSGREGMDLLGRVRQLDPDLPVVVMTAWGSVDGAVEAMRRGAKDYVEKPWDNARLIATIRTQLELGTAKRHGQRLAQANRHRNELPLQEFVAESKTMRPILDLMASVGPSDANVLITGEHGTGKEVVAKWLHAASPRASQPFLAVNAGGFSEGVLESELFGHVRGAFTDAKSDRAGCFELADQGTLFLDEIANLPYGQQAKLLRVLETREVQRVGSTRPARSTCGSSRRPTRTSRARSPRANSGRICSTASTPWRSSCLPCAKGRRISKPWPFVSSPGRRCATARSSTASTPGPWKPFAAILGRATSASCSTRWNERSWWQPAPSWAAPTWV